MGKSDGDTKPQWQNFLENDWMYSVEAQGARVYEIVVKLRPSGMLAILKRRRHAEYQVAFVGGNTLPGLSAKIRGQLKEEVKGWREDEFAST